jgi:hypothetical protein
VATDEELENWLPSSQLDLLKCERIERPEVTDAELARERLMRAAPLAAASVAHLAIHGRTEQIRLAASKYIIDGVVGGGFSADGHVDDVLLALVSKLADNDSAAEQMRTTMF